MADRPGQTAAAPGENPPEIVHWRTRADALRVAPDGFISRVSPVQIRPPLLDGTSVPDPRDPTRWPWRVGPPRPPRLTAHSSTVYDERGSAPGPDNSRAGSGARLQGRRVLRAARPADPRRALLPVSRDRR